MVTIKMLSLGEGRIFTGHTARQRLLDMLIRKKAEEGEVPVDTDLLKKAADGIRNALANPNVPKDEGILILRVDGAWTPRGLGLTSQLALIEEVLELREATSGHGT